MSIVTWNVRGFHKFNRIMEVKRIIKSHNVGCFGVIEAKLMIHELVNKHLMGNEWNIMFLVNSNVIYSFLINKNFWRLTGKFGDLTSSA